VRHAKSVRRVAKLLSLAAFILFSPLDLRASPTCESLFKIEFHHGFRDSSPNDFFDTVPRYYPKSRARHSLGFIYWELPFETETAETVPPTWSALAEFLQPGVVEARCPQCRHPAKTRIAVASILARAHGRSLQPGEPIPLEELEFQAQLLGTHVEMAPLAFRVDWRTPQDVAKTGFQPNPSKSVADLWDHVRPDNVGGGNLVSVSLAKVHVETVKFIMARGFELANAFTGGTPSIIQPGSATAKPANIESVKLYEYMMIDVAGVNPPAAFSVAAEGEMVVPDVAPWQISYYRVLSVKIKNGQLRSVKTSRWEQMPPPI
jgi:hypothetical protein